MKKILIMLMLTLLVSFLVRVANTRIIRVPSDFPCIQGGIDNANDGDTVLVDSGTYVEGINFKGKGILLTSVAGAESTVIDGDSAGTVVSFVSGEDTTSVSKGLLSPTVWQFARMVVVFFAEHLYQKSLAIELSLTELADVTPVLG